MCIFITALLPSCKEDDGSGHIFKMNIENNPQNLDPQMAADDESVMIITNMMEGLMKTDASGAVVPAAAECFSMSEDGMTYTFYLKQNRMWESLMEDFSEPVTADDFVFAFRRLFDADTASPHSGDYTCIKNGSAVLKGILPASELGVRAVDDHTVEFTLEYPYYNFLTLLAETPAMPCCRTFFELTKGKYGMAADACASNGAFYLKEWNYDPYWDNNYLIMRRNTAYSEADYVYPYSINFFITRDGSADGDSFSAGDTDCFIAEKYDEKLFADNNRVGRSVKTAGLLINSKNEYLRNKRLREALAKSVNRDSYSHLISEQFTAAYGIIPGGITVQGKSYRDLSPDRLLSVYDVNSAQLWADALNSAGIDSVDGLKITVSENFSAAEAIYDITDKWRSGLLFDCGVETVSQTEYGSKLESGDFDIALVEIRADKNSPQYFLGKFCGNDLFTGNAKLASDISELNRAVSLSDGVERIKAAESEIIGDYLFIPVCFENEYLVSGEKSADLVYCPFSSSVRFGEAKYFD
ncbi:MAG: peptide ABC transporter substrate-binding protein [Prevotella sp.]|nr:peptide ABC transporter substrate-binding protein [Prevotella sp.]